MEIKNMAQSKKHDIIGKGYLTIKATLTSRL